MAVRKRNTSLTNQQKRDWAKLLYIKDNKTQKEIAATVGVTEKTLSKWVNDDDWEMLRSSFVITKDQELRRIYLQINELNNTINEREKGKRYATGAEADTLSKLASTAKALESDLAIADIINVFIDFVDYLRSIDLKQAQDITMLQDSYIKHKMSRH